jgi:hypothetical protein
MATDYVDDERAERVARRLYELGHGFDIDADPVARSSMLEVARELLAAAGSRPPRG